MEKVSMASSSQPSMEIYKVEMALINSGSRSGIFQPRKLFMTISLGMLRMLIQLLNLEEDQ